MKRKLSSILAVCLMIPVTFAGGCPEETPGGGADATAPGPNAAFNFVAEGDGKDFYQTLVPSVHALDSAKPDKDAIKARLTKLEASGKPILITIPAGKTKADGLIEYLDTKKLGITKKAIFDSETFELIKKMQDGKPARIGAKGEEVPGYANLKKGTLKPAALKAAFDAIKKMAKTDELEVMTVAVASAAVKGGKRPLIYMTQSDTSQLSSKAKKLAIGGQHWAFTPLVVEKLTNGQIALADIQCVNMNVFGRYAFFLADKSNGKTKFKPIFLSVEETGKPTQKHAAFDMGKLDQYPVQVQDLLKQVKAKQEVFAAAK